MKNVMTIYKIITYIILPLAGILALFDLILLFAALAYPFLFLGVFIITSVVIYTITSFIFYSQGLQKQIILKPSLKDWIKVNAYVAIVFAILNLLDNISLLGSPTFTTDMIKQINEMKAKMPQQQVSTTLILQVAKSVLYIVTIYAALLLGHIFITMRLVRDNSKLFGAKGQKQ